MTPGLRMPPLGGLRMRVTVQAEARTPNTFGEPVLSWSDVVTVWGDVQDLAGAELWRAQQVQSEATVKVTTRYLGWLTPVHRLVTDGKTYQVESVVNPDGRKRFSVSLCRSA